ncbi:MAG: peptidase [Bacteroidetes bacterium]|jgi:murein DD-endopeptidase MepM/ murein hydrolase activator NlpD|nr:peptidase [Bacteroidota bacterium]MBS1233905.1 peptidase [Bacteroidota bacterium]
MSEKKEKKSFFKKFKHKYRLSIYRDETFEELLNLKLTKLNVLALVSVLTFIFLVIVISIIAYTPARELIPGYPDDKTVRNIRLNAHRLDSLELEIKKRDAYFENIRRIVAGEEPEQFNNPRDSVVKKGSVSFQRSAEDSALRSMTESDKPYTLLVDDHRKVRTSLSNVLFFSPVKGLITNSFKPSDYHYGTDVVAAPNEVVKAVLEGTVIMASWTLETGNVIQIQHENDLVSVYKHNAELLKRVGDRVTAGEPIAIIGNSGEFTTGPHLHFELWHNGTPLNPENYVTF